MMDVGPTDDSIPSHTAPMGQPRKSVSIFDHSCPTSQNLEQTQHGGYNYDSTSIRPVFDARLTAYQRSLRSP